MLVLTRRMGESIAIGEDVVVTVLSVSGGQVRIGVSAPRNVRVLREEIFKTMQEENREAAQGLRSPQQLEEVWERLQQRKTRGLR